MSKLRKNYFLALDLKVVDGDVFNCPARGRLTVGVDISAWVANDYKGRDRTIESFAPRKNTGKQPCGDEIPIILTEDGCSPGYKRATSQMAEWNNPAWYPQWSPDYASLIEMQYEHDKQGKTVVDVIRECYRKGVLNIGFGYYANQIGAISFDGAKVCTVEEFKRCVDDLSKYANKLSPNHYDYEQYKIGYALENKPKMKIEYVGVNGNDKVIAGCFSTDTLYYMSSNSHNPNGTQYTEIKSLEELSIAAVVYRKVETEIKTEKRWIAYNPKTRIVIDCPEVSTVHGDFQQIEITVEV